MAQHIYFFPTILVKGAPPFRKHFTHKLLPTSIATRAPPQSSDCARQFQPVRRARITHEVGKVGSFGAVARRRFALRAAGFSNLRREGVKVVLRHGNTCGTEHQVPISGVISGILQYNRREGVHICWLL